MQEIYMVRLFQGQCGQHDIIRKTRHRQCILSRRPFLSLLGTRLLEINAVGMLKTVKVEIKDSPRKKLTNLKIEKNNFMTIKIRQLIYTIIIGDDHNDKKYIEYIHIIFLLINEYDRLLLITKNNTQSFILSMYFLPISTKTCKMFRTKGVYKK